MSVMFTLIYFDIPCISTRTTLRKTDWVSISKMCCMQTHMALWKIQNCSPKKDDLNIECRLFLYHTFVSVGEQGNSTSKLIILLSRHYLFRKYAFLLSFCCYDYAFLRSIRSLSFVYEMRRESWKRRTANHGEKYREKWEKDERIHATPYKYLLLPDI